MAFPHLSQLARKYRDRGLVVVGINMEQDSPQLRTFVAQQVRGRGRPQRDARGCGCEPLAAAASCGTRRCLVRHAPAAWTPYA